MCSVLENNQSVHVYSILCSSMEILEISFKQDFYWSINISRVIRAAVVPASTIGPQIITLPCTLHNLIVKSPSTHYLHSSHRDKQTTGTAPVSRKSVRVHRVRPLKYAYLNPSRKGSASFLSPRAKSLSLRQLARLAASTLYSRTSAGPHRFPPPKKGTYAI